MVLNAFCSASIFNLPDNFSAGFEEIVEAYPRAGALLEVALPMWLAGAGESADQALPVYLQPELPWRKRND